MHSVLLLSHIIILSVQVSTPAVTTTVRRSEEISLEVTAGQIIVWKFHLENHDVGFTVEVNGEVKVSQTPRVNNEI